MNTSFYFGHKDEHEASHLSRLNASCIDGQHAQQFLTTSQHYVIYAMTSLVCLLILFGNGLVIWSFFRFRSLLTRTNRFLLSLTIADLLTAPAVMTLMLVNLFSDWTMMNVTYYPCLFAISLNIYSTLVSMFSLLGVGIERYIKVLYPLRYKCMLSPGLSITFIAFIWLISMPIAGVMYKFNNFFIETGDTRYGCSVNVVPRWHMKYVTTPLVGVSIAICTFLHIKVFIVAWRQRRFETIATVGFSSLPVDHEKDMNLLKMATMILGVMYVTWLPLILINFIYQCEHTIVILVIRHSLDILNYANSAVNPFIYQWHQPEFRHAFQRLLRISKPKENTNTRLKIVIDR